MSLRHKASKRRLEQLVDQWNARHNEGTPVRVKLDGGKVIETKTASQATVLGGHSAVIWLEGISGCYALERVEAL